MVDLASVERAGDRGVLEQLIARGDPLTPARETIVFFYRRDDDERDPERVLNPLAQQLTLDGWIISNLDAESVVAEAQRSVDPDSINALGDRMEALAAAFDVEYDGWECAVLSAGAP